MAVDRITNAYLLLLILNTIILCTTSVTSKNQSNFQWGGLYPRESLSREVRSLDGLWDFRLAPLHQPDLGFEEKWYLKPLKLSGDTIKMAVPSSYNDVTEDKAIRDHIGWAWYDRTFFIPGRWIEEKKRIVLRLGSAHYYSIIYINGIQVAAHEGGHLPIMADIGDLVRDDGENLVTICINNTLTPETIPQGSIVHQGNLSRYPPGYFVQNLDFDFFNYAGLHRPIYIYTTPATYVEDIILQTDVINGTTGSITYTIAINSTSGSIKGAGCSLKLYNKNDEHIKSAIGCRGQIDIQDANLWWPYLMSESPGYLYTLLVTVSDAKGNLDAYPQKVGIRRIEWNSTTVAMNGKQLYLMGCDKHEDSNIRGKGLDYPLLLKDFSLLKWLGANSFRSSHYPYAEEIMDMADEEGIMVIDESPAVGLSGFGDELLTRHISVMQELVRRDKNRPSVIAWSLGNEPRSGEPAAEGYFKQVVNATRSLDSTRPITCVLNAPLEKDLAAYSLDLILVNRYFAWYSDTGHLEVITRQTVTEFAAWHFVHRKPVMISEYGAGALAGVHTDPSFLWSEEYQVDLMSENFKAFDELRKMGFFFGEMIWNFADFATAQETFRPPGCMKGLFTRERQPKMAARVMRSHYWKLAKYLYNSSTTAQAPSSVCDIYD